MIPSESKIIAFLRGKPAQTVCAVAQHFNAPARDIRQVMHDMVADGDLVLIRGEKRKELFEPAHGGYDPEPKGAA